MKPILGIITAIGILLSPTYVKGDDITIRVSTLAVTITNPSPNARDWVGLYLHAAENTAYLDWNYFACDAKNCPTLKPTTTTRIVHLNIPSSYEGGFDIRLLSATGSPVVYTVLAEIDP